MKVLAKFVVHSIVENPESQSTTVRLHAAIGSGNETWSKYTPYGNLEMIISNRKALDLFVPGANLLLTFEDYDEGYKV